MAELKTKPTSESVQRFLDAIEDPKRRSDCLALLELMREVTGFQPKMWGTAMVGFGQYHYRYESGREGDWFLTGFSPRKSALTIYITAGFERYDDIMQHLGKYKTGKSCLYIKHLADVDLSALGQLIEESVQHVQRVNA